MINIINTKSEVRMKRVLLSILFIGFLGICIVFAGADEPAADDPISTKNLNVFSWRHIGPWTFSGRFTDFAVPRGQSKVYYVATASGGLFKTEDSGTFFKPVFEKYGNQSMGNVEVAPSNPDIVYLGTGEPLHARSSAHGNGMWKSTNGGRTWEQIGLEQSYFIPKIAIDDKNPDIVYVAVEGKLYDNEMDCQRGLYKTVDGGKTWNQVLDLKDRGVGDFIIDPGNSDIIIASAYKTYRRTWTFLDRQPENHLYKSIDGGETWNKLREGLPLDIETGWNGLTIYPKDPNIVYVRMDEEVNLGFHESENYYLFREGNLFKDDYYFNKFASYKIPAPLAKLVKLEPVSAENEEELVKKVNDLIKDKEFQDNLTVELAEFNQKARDVYSKNKDTLKIIDEIEKTSKREKEQQKDLPEVNGFLLKALFYGSDGIEFKEDKWVVTDAEKIVLTEDFQKIVKFDEEKVKDVKDLAVNANTLTKDPELMDKLGIKSKRAAMAAKKVYKDQEEMLEAVSSFEEKAKEISQGKERYQTFNRYILQMLYADVLREMEPVTKSGVIYRSEDQGESWKRMTEYKLFGGSMEVNRIEAGYSGRIEVDPNDDQVLYAVEVVVKKSKDGGKTFQDAPWIGRHKCHVDTRGIWIDPLDSEHILNANDGGVSETWDGGKHWSQKDTISAQQFYEISVDNEVPYNVMGGTQDNGCWLGPSRNRNRYGVYPADWIYLPSGDGYYVERDWWNPEFIYFESQFGWSRRMNLKTGEMINLSRRNTDEERAAGKPPQRYQWDAPLVLSPHNPGIVYVCSQHVHMSRSRGDEDTWVTISPDLSRNEKDKIELSKETNLQYGTIYTFAESPVEPGVYWAGTDDGNLQMSKNGGKTWTNITYSFYEKNGKAKKAATGVLIPFDRWVSNVEPSAHDVNTCYVTYSGYRTHNEDTSYIYVTRDMGKTWEDLSQGMMNPVRDIEEDPDNADVLYLATDYGLFVSIDAGKEWTEMSSSAPDVIIMDIDIQKRERDLAIGTYGRGIYIADIYPFKEFGGELFEKDAYLFDIQPTVKWNMRERRGPTFGEFARVDNPQTGAMMYLYLKKSVKTVKLLVKDLEGNLVQELKSKMNPGIHKVFWNLRKKTEGEEEQRFMGSGRNLVDPGHFKVTLLVDDEEVITKSLEILDDPVNE